MLLRIRQWENRLDKRSSLVVKALAGAGGFLALSAVFAYLPSSPYLYSDWPYFWGSARLALQGKSPYLMLESLYFYNPPWVAVVLAPLGLFPVQFSAGMATALSLLVLLLLCRRYELNLFKTALLGLSPPVVVILWLGQIDLLVLGGVLLPVSWWPVAALSKPQAALGLGFHALQKPYIKQAALVAAAVIGLSFLLFGLWPLEILGVPSPTGFDWNFWKGIWPWSIIPGIVLVMLGVGRKNERYLLAASPFLMPYTTIPGFAGPLLALFTELEDWQAAALFLAIWGVTIWQEPGFCGIC